MKIGDQVETLEVPRYLDHFPSPGTRGTIIEKSPARIWSVQTNTRNPARLDGLWSYFDYELKLVEPIPNEWAELLELV